jgi:hypothetical protein
MIESVIQCFLVSYFPLAWTKSGRRAAERSPNEPFEDGSIRREPDLKHELPAITALCRGDRFVPRLEIGNVVGYLAKKSLYFERGSSTEEGTTRHRRLTALLRVIERFESHNDAADWYRNREFESPNNLMLDGNPPKPLDDSHRKNKYRHLDDEKQFMKWDKEYQQRARDTGTVLICEIMFRNLSWQSPKVEDVHLRKAFGKIPGTENPGTLNCQQFQTFLNLIGIPVQLSSP